MAKSKLRDFAEFFLIFLVLYFLVQFSLKLFFPQYFGGEKNGVTGVTISMQDATVKNGHHPVVIIKNGTEEALVLEDKCPMPPFDVYKDEKKLETTETAMPCVALTGVEPGGREVYELSPWKYSLFSELGEYKLVIPDINGAEVETSVDFKIHEAGPITRAFRAFITKPFLNLLVLIASVMPGYSLGIAIIILTILVKLVLFIPTQHGLEGQKKLQAVQPQLDALKRKYKGDPQKLQQETMRIWKENKVNPLQSCLPILIQFPILIGLFFVIRDGSVLELSRHLLYGPHQDLSWTFGTNFFGLNLLEPSKILMPPLLAGSQFAQMKLSFAIAKKKKDKSGKKETQSAQEMQQKMMMYGLPLMIGFFALQFPAAVSLYWGVSTFFAIGQQVVVNRRDLR
ncbi:MAG: YidC/Oxa1 family membrane protein insertase [Candidatus Peribacteraceae bacterium]|jgi:YidC/Oxa1 family membrane protein insertase|nr:YidC/Oxa1 family membrane protein insertase [Candidatus Peribacteraceae bacterium]HCI03321.1 hypothetical protein [Candidatus Peribacteria bacterium]|tara:strand:- start:4578 stop:5771 length:1194 start_codon:yes stop_codon:yes gene_type:complete